MKIDDYIPEPRKLQPLWPKCHCFDEREARVPKSPETDATLAAFLYSRRTSLGLLADEMAIALYAGGDAMGFCRDARRYLAALAILSICAKLNDKDDPDPIDLKNRSHIDARAFTTRANLDDLLPLVEDLMEGSLEAFRAKTKE